MNSFVQFITDKYAVVKLKKKPTNIYTDYVKSKIREQDQQRYKIIFTKIKSKTNHR